MLSATSHLFCGSRHRPATADGGSVLIVVLVVCLGLVSMTLLFGRSMLMSYRGSDDNLAGRQAFQAVEGAARYAGSLLTNVTNEGDLPDVTTYQREAMPVGDAMLWLIGEPLPSDPQDKPVYGLVDEASKLNLNRASAAMLLNLPGMTDDLAQAIAAWHSTNGSPFGLSASGFSTAPVKNASFESVEELAQVNGGVDLPTLFGKDANLNHALDPWEEANGAPVTSGLLEYVTAFSREPTTRRDGIRRVSVLDTGSSRLRDVLNLVFPGGRGTAIHKAAAGPGRTPRKVKSVLEYFIYSTMSVDEFAKVSPLLCMSNAAYDIGLVNVNTASQTVLSCVPGISYDLAGQLVAARSKMNAPAANLAWVTPILGAASVQAGPYLTTRCYQVSVDAAAAGRNGRGYRRTRFVVDASTAPPKIVYRRDLSGLGWALGLAARQTFAAKGVPR